MVSQAHHYGQARLELQNKIKLIKLTSVPNIKSAQLLWPVLWIIKCSYGAPAHEFIKFNVDLIYPWRE